MKIKTHAILEKIFNIPSNICFVAINFGSNFTSNDTLLTPSSQMAFPTSNNQFDYYAQDSIPLVTEQEGASSLFSNERPWQDLSLTQGFY